MKQEPICCSLCELRHTVKTAEAWCSICQKGFCNKCRYSHLSTRKNRTHKFITVEKYQSGASPMSLICKDHESKSHYYCKAHDELVCILCKPEAHKNCEGVSSLQDASKTLQMSSVTHEFDRTIKSLAENIQKAIANRTKNLTSLKDQKKKIEEEIVSVRNNLNEQLNKLQEELTLELSKTFQKQKCEIEECLKLLDKSKTEMQNLKEQSEKLAQSPSTSIQNFLATLQIKKKFKHEEMTISDAIKSSKPISLVLKPSTLLQGLSSDAKTLGTIEVQRAIAKKQTESNATKSKLGTSRPRPKSFTSIKLDLIENVKKPSGNQTYVKNCAFKADGQMVFAEPENKVLSFYDKKGTFTTSLTVSGHPFDVASINYCTVALTFEKQNTIQVIDTTFNKVSKTVHAKNACRGISYMNGQIFVVVKGEGILILDTLGKIKKTLPVNVSDVHFICASNSRLCYTNGGTKSIHCCDLRGKELWVFKDKSIECPLGITIDSFGNAFVLCTTKQMVESSLEGSYNVVLVSPDGSSCKVVLKRTGCPSGIDFDKKYRRLLLYNLDGSANLYSVNAT